MFEINIDSLENSLREKVLAISRLVRAKGGRAYMVGGAVRDIAMGVKSIKDVDMEVFGLRDEELRAALAPSFKFDVCGASFGVLKIKGCDIDVALPRRESKCGVGHKEFIIEADPEMSVHDAATRRDFTINALYYDPIANKIEDPFDACGDMSRRILRHVSKKFSEDPLRVLRGMQFVARFSLSPAPETIAICRDMEIEGLPAERLFEEWSKLLTKGVAIGKGLNFLRDTTWVKYFPELAALIGCEQDPFWHPEGDVWNHTLLALDAFAKHRIGDNREDEIVGLAVLCHDFGKPATTAFDPVAKRLRSRGHDEAGVKPTLSFLRRITNEERILRDVPALVKAHMAPFALWKANAGDSAIRRLALRVGRIDRLIRVSQADDEGREITRDENSGEELRWLAREAERLRVEAEAPKPIFQGRDLLAMGFTPGPEIGKILAKMFEAQLDGAFSDVASARDYFSKNFPTSP